MDNAMDRRNFVKATAAAGVVAAAPYIIPQTAFGANDRVVMGIIGPGGRGRGLMQEHINLGAKFAAVSDVNKSNLKAGMDRAKEDNDLKVDAYEDYRDMLDRKDIDAMIIATPEHQHGVQLIDCVQAGYDVYCEKPMSHSIEEGNKIVKEVRKTDRIVQIGMQRRSSPIVREAKKVFETGILGRVNFVRAHWDWKWGEKLDNSPLPEGEVNWKLFMRPAKNVQYEPMKVRYWRFFWAFSGGNICDQGTHLMDVVQWFTGDGTPLEAECFGDVRGFIGSETPDVFTAIYRYKSFIASWTLNYTSDYDHWWHITFQGDKGTMEVDEEGFRVFEEPCKDKKEPVIHQEGGLPTRPHVENFLECLKSRQEPNAPVEVGHTAVCGPHLGNVAYHHERRAKLSPDAKKVSV